MTKLIPIQGQLQTYQWGGLDYLPSLLQYTNSLRQPQAEYWLGVHPAAPAKVLGMNGETSLADTLAEHQHQLNFLLKILDVREMLSIQVHPSKRQAEAGFAYESQLGIELSAKHRNYKDANHKPELMVALSEFWLLHGFKTEAEIAANLAGYAYLHPLLKTLKECGLRAAFEFSLDGQNPLVAHINASLKADFARRPLLFDKHATEFWIQRWLCKNPDAMNGLLTLFFLNLVKVNPGEALYQPAGLLHAYLEGQNVELMANSDNVLRAGLTPKHIDVPELLEVCLIEPTAPQDYVIQPQILPNQEKRFPAPFDEFELSELHSRDTDAMHWQPQAPEILICVEGRADITCADHVQPLNRGQALLVLPGADVSALFRTRPTQIYKAKNL